MAQAHLNITPLATPPTDNLQTNHIYLDDGTNTASGYPGWRRYTGAAWVDIGGNNRVKTSTANVTNPPTAAELISAFGAAATVGAGFTALVNDNNGDANNYLVISNGTSYWYATLTKAT